eukprot:2905-Heterococcus_DN1.PRE.1
MAVQWYSQSFKRCKEAHGQQQNTTIVLLALVKHYRFAHQLTITDTVRGIRACMLLTMRYFDGQCVCTTTYVTAKVSAAAKTATRLHTVPLKPCLQCVFITTDTYMHAPMIATLYIIKLRQHLTETL